MSSVTRRLAVMAWIAATALSVAVSTAAVASVRAQVTERPDVVSIAALRRATTTTQPQPVAAPTTTTSAASAIEATTTTRPSVEATPATTVETVPPPTTRPRSDSTQSDPGSTRTETRTFRGGTVTISFDGVSLTLLSAEPEDGYALSVEEETGRRITVRFVDEGRSTAFVARIVRDGLSIRVYD